MQSTGQTSTQALSLTLMQGSAMTYAISYLLLTRCSTSDGFRSAADGKPTYLYQLVPQVSSRRADRCCGNSRRHTSLLGRQGCSTYRKCASHPWRYLVWLA